VNASLVLMVLESEGREALKLSGELGSMVDDYGLCYMRCARDCELFDIMGNLI
jgi:hypothetical protein